MVVAAGLSGSPTNASLLLTTAETLREIAKLLRSNGASRESKNFYASFMAHCLLIRHHINRVKSSVANDHPLLVDILDRFEAIVKPAILDTRPAPAASIYPRLRALNQAWNKTREDSDDQRRLFIQKSVDFVCNTDQPDRLIEFLEDWEDEITEQYPDDPSLWADGHVPQSKSRAQPSYAVWNASQSLFRALLESKECECDPTHEVDVRLFLSTFRKLPGKERDPADSDYGFEIFLSLQKEWHEANVNVAKTGTAIRFNNDDSSKAKKLPAMKVKHLCEPIKKRKPFDRIKLRVDDDGRLWKLRSEKCCFAIDESRPPISLQQFIQDQYRSLTDKTKRILAVMLGYTVLYLHETPWLPSTWGPSSILFFHTTSSSIPLKPFIQIKLARDHAQNSETKDTDPDDFDPDDLDPDDIMMHQCPHLVTLGIVLVELYLATTFEELAEKYNIPLNDRTRSIDAELVFSKCKSEIPENSQFHYAVEKCLDPKVWEDENGTRLDDQTLKITIYQEVIRPLEDELNHAFSYIPIEDLDRIAQTLDLGSWGQITQIQQQVNAQPVVAALESPKESIYNTKQQQHLQQLFLPGQWHVGTPIVVPIFQQSVPNQNIQYHEDKWRQLGYKGMRFFDDETVSEEHSAEARINYSNWRRRFKEVYEKYITEPPKNPVKIAILDTGIDQTHPDIDACIEQIKGQYNWTNEKFTKHVEDHNGHGTFTAGLLLEYLPDAELYIAKISDGNPCSPGNIAKAIDYAIDEWKVDMISMSFGYPTREIESYEKLETAIHKAYSNHTLLFAAASNSGANLDRAYPARDENVICIHSTDANGNRSPFSPTALADALNLATVGEAVESSWPLRLCDPGSSSVRTKYKSGTSFATPIAVSIAAFLLQYVRANIPDHAHMLKRQSRMKAVLRKIAEKTQESKPRDDYHYVALSRYSDNLFGKEREYLNYTLRDLLSQ